MSNSPFFQRVKRLIDILVSGLEMILLSPILFYGASQVPRSRGSTISFRQRRPSLHGKPFFMYKTDFGYSLLIPGAAFTRPPMEAGIGLDAAAIPPRSSSTPRTPSATSRLPVCSMMIWRESVNTFPASRSLVSSLASQSRDSKSSTPSSRSAPIASAPQSQNELPGPSPGQHSCIRAPMSSGTRA